VTVTLGSNLRAAALVFGLGTTVVMWAVGFAARLPGQSVPNAALLLVLLLLFVGGGFVAGRVPGGGVRAGAGTGAVASLVNLLVLGSLLAGDQPNRVVPAAILWLPGSLLLGVCLGGLGGWLGASRPQDREPHWNGLLARIAGVATLLLVAVGGLVTSHEAGLAVVDWPNSYGYNMFLFPLSRMVGGIYYEHAHRLIGSLVGLTTLVLAARLLATDPRRAVKVAGVVALLLVIGQGILGGLRVTGHFTMSDSSAVTRPSTGLAVIHGITGQLFLAWIAALAVVTSRTWMAGPLTGDKSGDRRLPWVLVGCLLIQLVLGVHVRHLGRGTWIHVGFAMVVLLVAIAVAVRTLGDHSGLRPLRKSGGALIGHVVTQVLLGGWALVAVSQSPEAPPTGMEILAATAHQTVGALLLANAVILALWHRRVKSA
jgi:cytochrome c oxidase assembly protein subunit 15